MRQYQYYIKNWLPEEDFEKLKEKYETQEQSCASILSEQICAKLSNKDEQRDEYRLQTQKLTAQAITILGALITELKNDDDGFDFEDFIKNVANATRLLVTVQYRTNNSRKFFIVPRFTKMIQETLKKTETDTSLFGKNMKERDKTTKEADTLFKNSIDTNHQEGNFKRLTNKPPC